jgi:hypothetical protein
MLFNVLPNWQTEELWYEIPQHDEPVLFKAIDDRSALQPSPFCETIVRKRIGQGVIWFMHGLANHGPRHVACFPWIVARAVMLPPPEAPLMNA